MLLSLYPNRHLYRDQEPVEPALPDAGGAHENQEPPGQMVRHLFSGIQRRLWGLESGKREDGAESSAPPGDILKLGVEGVNQIWRDAKLRGDGMKRAKPLVSAAGHSVGRREAVFTNTMNVMSNGNVYPCCSNYVREIPSLCAGNIHEEDFETIYNRLKTQWPFRLVMEYGLQKLVAVIRKVKPDAFCEEYTDDCELCKEIWSNKDNIDILYSFYKK